MNSTANMPPEALVGIAEAEGVEIVLDRKQQRITVTFRPDSTMDT